MYSIVAMMTELEWDTAVSLCHEHANTPIVQEACRIVQEHFATSTSKGILRIKESPNYRQALDLDRFRTNLSDLFPAASGGNE
jgi:hypothetical protein